MDSDPPDATHTLVHTGTQTVMDIDSSTVCTIETPTPTTAPTTDPNPSPSPHLPSDPQACVDRALIYALSPIGSNVKELQQSDADIRQVLAWLEDGQRPRRWRLKEASWGLKRLWHEFPQLTFVDGMLCRVVRLSDVGLTTQVVVPAVLVPEVLRHLHGMPLTAHLAYEQVLANARSLCYWPTMYNHVRPWCDQCYVFQRRTCDVREVMLLLREVFTCEGKNKLSVCRLAQPPKSIMFLSFCSRKERL
ncbi:hypothetical protein F7725_009500%2C partial [Xyrichtys novacula]|uniref:Gypsy retrotransposon integrase-like protein 1 n=1 Tax=Xyrichtys novacula TaxID=13765 RepID=A0AAV1G0T2_XYRNO|nr:hypothetical protein F7725_009500%2C partial [Xyrichtys novacula]